jgi:phosphoribosylanthranilate isomerase
MGARDEEVSVSLTYIKICGITNEEDAELAIEYGADALGFIMVPESKRYVPADELERIATSFKSPSPFTSIVAVVRNVVDARNVDVADCAQFYEGSPLDSNGRQRLIPVLRIKSILDLSFLSSFVRPGTVDNSSRVFSSVQAVLLDTYTQHALGGAGKAFDWSIAIEAKNLSPLPIIVAGGLAPDNVANMLENVRPYAVDASSGVESSPGKKDKHKLKDFIQAVRGFDREKCV